MTNAQRPLRWGVLGATSAIAQDAVLPALAAGDNHEVVALGSRNPAFADGPERPRRRRFGADKIFTGESAYEAVVAEESVDALYVPLPNAMHRRWVEEAARAGKHVLCEKPLAVSVADARSMVAACERAGVHLMEAYMTPFHPRSVEVARLSTAAQLGSLRSARSVFTFPHDDPADFRWQQSAGGGALLDVGVYCVAPLLEAAGRLPVSVVGRSTRSASGIDAATIGLLDFGDGFVATIECSFVGPERQELEIVGARSAIRVPRAFTPSFDDPPIELVSRDGQIRQLDTGEANPYEGMVDHAADVFRGMVEPMRSLDQSIDVLTVLDQFATDASAARP